MDKTPEQEAHELVRALDVADTIYKPCVSMIERAITEAEKRGEQRVIDRIPSEEEIEKIFKEYIEIIQGKSKASVEPGSYIAGMRWLAAKVRGE